MNSAHFEVWQWALLVCGAMAWGASKAGLPGVGILFVGVFAWIFPAKQATGVVLPLLIFADVLGFVIYRNHLEWRRVGRLLPWAVGGVVIGWLMLGRVDDRQAARVVGAIIAVLLALQLWRTRGVADQSLVNSPVWLAPLAGLFAGFATIVANAAGPILVIYLLAMRLPKLEFLGTSAAFFLLINWIKLPFVAQLGLVNGDSLVLNLWLAPAVVVGALLGRWGAARINQKTFELTALALAAVAAVKLLVF